MTWGGVLAAAILAAAEAQGATGEGSLTLVRTAVVEPGARPVVYLTAPAGQVEAVDARSGRVLWRNPKLAFLLLARGARALGLRQPGPVEKGGCAPVLVDAATGRILRPMTVTDATPPGCPGDSINSRSDISGFWRGDRGYVGWVYTWFPTPGGAYKGPDYVYPPGSFGSGQGAIEVDLLTGVISPAATGLVDSVAALNPRANPPGATVIVDGLSARADREGLPGPKWRLTLRRWRGDLRLPDIDLGEPPWQSCGASFSLDRRHVLAVWQVPERRAPFLYHTRVFEVASGKLVAEFDAASWPVAAQVCGSTLIAYFPWRVFGIDLKTGRERWSRPVADLEYRGSYPP